MAAEAAACCNSACPAARCSSTAFQKSALSLTNSAAAKRRNASKPLLLGMRSTAVSELTRCTSCRAARCARCCRHASTRGYTVPARKAA